MTRRDEVQAEIARLQAELDAIDKLPPAMLPVEGEWYLDSRFHAEPDVIVFAATTPNQNIFPTEEIAQAYGNAFSVMLELRRQPGSGVRKADGVGYVPNEHGSIDWYGSSECFVLCPPFPSGELAEAARGAVGRERIVAAYKTLTGVV